MICVLTFLANLKAGLSLESQAVSYQGMASPSSFLQQPDEQLEKKRQSLRESE